MATSLPTTLYRSAAVPGVTVARYESEGILYAGIKERHSVSLVEAGWSEWWFEGRTYRTGPGSLLLRWRGGVHRDLLREGRARFQVVTFDPALVQAAQAALAREGRGPRGSAVVGERHPRAVALHRLHAVFRAEPDDALAAETVAAEALAAVAELLDGEGDAPPRRFRAAVRRARAFLEERCAENVGLEALAGYARLDRFHLCRAFREEVGLPPHAYRTHLRVNRARALLARGVAPGAVAAEVGFFDQSQLTRHFRRVVGLTPGQFAQAVGAGRPPRSRAGRDPTPPLGPALGGPF